MPATKAQALVPGLVDPGRRPGGGCRGARAAGALGAAALRADRGRRSARRPRHRLDRCRPSAWRRGGDARRPGRPARPCPASPPAPPSPTPGAPRTRSPAIAARPTFVAPPGHGASVLAPLPIAALRLPAAMSSDLRVLGFDRIGDLPAQPRAPLALRFGPELGRRLDQALGAAGRADRAGPPARPDRGPPRLRRADRRRRDDRPLHRQAGGRASARRSRRRAWAPGASTCCSTASTTARRRSASARRSRCATPSG